jgi:hypothetical protein
MKKYFVSYNYTVPQGHTAIGSIVIEADFTHVKAEAVISTVHAIIAFERNLSEAFVTINLISSL